MAPREVITDPEELKKGGLALKKAWQAGAITEVECRVLFEKYDGACRSLSISRTLTTAVLRRLSSSAPRWCRYGRVRGAD